MSGNIVPVSVLIPTMNRPNALKRTLDGYLNAEFIPSQIVIVDQSVNEADSAEIKKILAMINDTEITYLYQNVPSLTKARNNAFKLATQEIIICSDDDIDVYSDTVKKVYKLMSSDSSLAMIAGVDDNMAMNQSKIGYLLGTKSHKNRKIGHVTLSMLGRFPEHVTERTTTMWAMGFFFVIRKSLADKWELQWDENLKEYAYAEDLDYSYGYYKKARKENYECIMSSDIHVKHLASKEYRIPSRKSTFMYVLNRFYLSKKHNMGWKADIAIKWCNFWIYIQRKIANNNAEDMKEAIIYLRKHKKEVENGVFTYGNQKQEDA